VQPSPGGAFVAYPNVAQGGVQAVDPASSHVRFLDVHTGKVGPPLDRGTGYRPPHGEGSWHPDGVHYALPTGGQIRIWDARTGELITQGSPSGPFIRAIDYSPDGTRLVVGELSGRVTMLDATTLSPVGRPVRLDDAVCCVSAGPDNHTAIALTGFDEASGFWVGWNTATKWTLVDLDSGTVLNHGQLGFHGRTVAYSPDGQHIAVGGTDGHVLELDARTGEPLRPPVPGHEGTVESLSYSPNSQRILTSSIDATVGLWDAATGLPLARVVAPKWPLAAEFDADSHTVIIAPLWDGPVYQWDTRTDHALDFACRIAGRDFTPTQWRDHFGDRRYQETCPSPAIARHQATTPTVGD